MRARVFAAGLHPSAPQGGRENSAAVRVGLVAVLAGHRSPAVLFPAMMPVSEYRVTVGMMPVTLPRLGCGTEGDFNA